MRIAVLTYTFGTPKTEAGIHHLVVHGFKPVLVLAAPPVPLDFYKSKIRVAPNQLYPETPEMLARGHGIEYAMAPHNSTRAAGLFREYGIDVAVILGARIIKQPLIDATRLGILNMHPGVLPFNRGLDNLKNAILHDMPQAVTGHLIDRRIDRGWEVGSLQVPILRDDTLMDIHLRLQSAERIVMIECLKRLANGDCDFRPVGKGTYFRAVSPDQEAGLMETFQRYKDGRAAN